MNAGVSVSVCLCMCMRVCVCVRACACMYKFVQAYSKIWPLFKRIVNMLHFR